MTLLPANLASAIDDLEKEIHAKQESLAALRRQIPPLLVSNYVFRDINGDTVHLSDLFGTHKELMVVQNMGNTCSYCTLWADEINGIIHHLENRCAFVIVSPNPPDVMRSFAESRAWRMKMYSCHSTSFKQDMGFYDQEQGYSLPGVSVFTRDEGGNIWHYNQAGFGPGDLFCSLWHYFALLPVASKSWYPKMNY